MMSRRRSDEQIWFVLNRLMEGVTRQEIVDHYKVIWDEPNFNVQAVKYIGSRYGNHPDFGAPFRTVCPFAQYSTFRLSRVRANNLVPLPDDPHTSTDSSYNYNYDYNPHLNYPPSPTLTEIKLEVDMEDTKEEQAAEADGGASNYLQPWDLRNFNITRPTINEQGLEDQQNEAHNAQSQPDQPEELGLLPPPTRCLLDHHPSSVSGINPRRGNKPLPHIIIDDPADPDAIRRARNTLAARKSRDKKALRLVNLEDQVARLTEECEYWKQMALRPTFLDAL